MAPTDQAIQESIAQYTQQQLQKQNSTLQANIAAAADKDPNVTAEAQQLGLQVGVGSDIASRNMAVVRKMALVQDVGSQNLPQTAPRLAKLLEDPNFSGVAYDDLGNLTRIEQGGATLRAMTPMERFSSRYLQPVQQKLMEYPLTRAAIDAVGGTAGMVGNIGSFLGWHGDGATRKNLLQRAEGDLSPEAAGNYVNGAPDTGNDLDAVVKNVAPMIPAVVATGGTGLLAESLGLSENAAKVLAAATVGAAFTADQGGRTFTQMAGAGKSDAEARRVANLVGALNLVPNTAMGLTDFVPYLNRVPIAGALAAGALTGGTGQFAQNLVTGQPWGMDVGRGAIQGAAVQAGMHIGFSFLDPMRDMVDATEQSKLRARSPQAFQQAMDAEFEGDESLRIPAQDFVSYFQGKKLDPALMANQVGATNLEEAAAAGSDLEIPKANFFARLDPEHQKGLLPDLVDPSTDMTARQTEHARAELQEWIAKGGAEKLQAEYAQADAETQATPEWQQVYSDLKQRYVNAGETEPAADSYATLHANAIANLAKNAGLKPDELLALHNPDIQKASPDGNVLYQSGAEDETPAIIDDPRLREAAPQPVLDRLDQSADAINSFASRPDEWNLVPAIRAAVGELASPSGERNPVVDALAQALNGDPQALKTAFKGYAHDATENESGRASTTNDAYDAFNRAFGSKLTPEEFHDGIERAAQSENTAGDADLPGAAAGGKGAGGEQADGTAGPGAARGGPERGDGDQQPGAAAESGAAHERAAHDGVNHAGSKRGWFRILPDGRYEIGKTEIGDMSTFIHEPAHAYLEMFRELTQREGASQPLKDDFRKICEWLGTTPEEAYKNGFTTEQHEQWARANEQYVREGNAPTSGLKRAFHNFAIWLSSIYRRAGALGVELSSDVRGVMDRLYAGDGAVDRAEQESGKRLFDNPEEAGWTEAEYKNYAEAKGLEVNEAKAQVLREMNEAALRERTQAWREEKGNVRDAVTQEIDARPEYAAIRSLRRGKTDLGTDLTLNRDELVKQFGEERVKALQQLHRGLYRQEGGTDAETAAEILGYGSGEEMMRGLEAAPRRAQAIEAAVREYLVAKYGDVRYDGTLTDRARFALENQERAGNIYRELRALRAKVGTLEKRAADAKAAMASITVEPLEHYQEAAKAMIDGKAIADLQPHRYLNATRMYSREAFDALRRGDVQRAAEAKNKELLNHFLFREASAARDYADKFESYAKRMQSRGIQQRLGLAGSDYRDQFNWLLARYKLGPAAQAPARSLRAWAEDVYGEGNEPAIAPGILNEGRFADYRNVPLSEVRDLHDALINVRHLAMREFKMYVQGKQVDFAEAKNAMIAGARENLRVKPEKIFDENLSAGERAAAVLQRGDAMLTRMERLVEWLDGGKTGPWHDNIWNLAADAQGDEYKLQEQVTHVVSDALADMSPEMRRRLWTEKVNVEGIGEPMSRRRLLSAAFNMGNEGNLDRLRKTFASFGWDPDAVGRIGGMLTREEWEFVQKTWDSLKPLGERMQELEKRLTGLPPAMVKVTPFRVALEDGTEMDLAGGYFPITMDPRFSERAIHQDAKETAQNAMQSGYVRATTSRGYTKERTGFGGPLLLDYEQVLTNHVAKVAKDLSHREFMLSSQRLLLDTEVRKTLRETLGPAYEKQFMPWLRTIINDRNGSVEQGLGDLSNMMQTLRSNIVAAEMGFKVSTSLLQITHAPRMVLYARWGSLAQSLIDFLANPREMTRQNQELSPNEMRFRGDSLDRDIRAELQKPEYQGGYARKVATAARFTLATVDHLFSHTLWRAAYRDALEKYSELPEGEAQKKAVYEADSAVRLGLGTQAPKDLPAIMRNSDFSKMITVLYGFHNGVYNQLRDNAHQFRYGGSVAKLTYATMLTAVLPAVLGSWVTGDGPKDGENAGLWAAKRSLLFAADTVPLLGSVAEFMARGHDMQFTPIENVMEKGAKAAMEASSDKDDKDWMGIGLDAGEAGGDLAGIPGSQQAVKTLRYIHRANQGLVADPNVWNALAGGGYR